MRASFAPTPGRHAGHGDSMIGNPSPDEDDLAIVSALQKDRRCRELIPTHAPRCRRFRLVQHVSERFRWNKIPLWPWTLGRSDYERTARRSWSRQCSAAFVSEWASHAAWRPILRNLWNRIWWSCQSESVAAPCISYASVAARRNRSRATSSRSNVRYEESQLVDRRFSRSTSCSWRRDNSACLFRQCGGHCQ